MNKTHLRRCTYNPGVCLCTCNMPISPLSPTCPVMRWKGDIIKTNLNFQRCSLLLKYLNMEFINIIAFAPKLRLLLLKSNVVMEKKLYFLGIIKPPNKKKYQCNPLFGCHNAHKITRKVIRQTMIDTFMYRASLFNNNWISTKYKPNQL